MSAKLEKVIENVRLSYIRLLRLLYIGLSTWLGKIVSGKGIMIFGKGEYPSFRQF